MKVYKCIENGAIKGSIVVTFEDILNKNEIYIGVLESPTNIRILLNIGRMQGFFPERFEEL
jgi:hypothetical protein